MPSKRTVPRICEFCGASFLALAREVRAGRAHYCSRKHWRLAYGAVEHRFWNYVTKADGCWLWTGARNEHGYGVLHVRSVQTGNLLAHRVSWEIHYQEVPAGTYVLHHCDNPPCVRPDHLFLGTKAENTRDMMRKGRAHFGGRAIGSDGRAIS